MQTPSRTETRETSNAATPAHPSVACTSAEYGERCARATGRVSITVDAATGISDGERRQGERRRRWHAMSWEQVYQFH